MYIICSFFETNVNKSKNIEQKNNANFHLYEFLEFLCKILKLFAHFLCCLDHYKFDGKHILLHNIPTLKKDPLIRLHLS